MSEQYVIRALGIQGVATSIWSQLAAELKAIGASIIPFLEWCFTTPAGHVALAKFVADVQAGNVTQAITDAVAAYQAYQQANP